MQHIQKKYNTLQHTAIHCNTLQTHCNTHTPSSQEPPCPNSSSSDVMASTASRAVFPRSNPRRTCMSKTKSVYVFHFVAVCCSVLSWPRQLLEPFSRALTLGVLAHHKERKKRVFVAVCCSVLLCGTVWYSVLQCVAVYCSALQCVVACCCSVLSWPQLLLALFFRAPALGVHACHKERKKRVRIAVCCSVWQ